MNHRLLALFLFGAAFLVSKTAFAQTFAGFDQFCNVPVIVENNPQDASAGRDGYGNRVIYVDPGVMANWTMSRMFALAHECGHHVLGHSTPAGMWFRNTQYWATRQQELAADCWAARQLAALRDQQDLRRMILTFAGQGPISRGPYPSGTERAHHVAECAGINIVPPPPVPYCCDEIGNRHCVIGMNPGPAGSMCACPGQGYGITCY